jgi:hypothetical protein
MSKWKKVSSIPSADGVIKGMIIVNSAYATLRT